MSTEIAKTVTRNTVILLGQYVLTSAATFVLMLFLPRYLGPVEFGKLFLSIAVVEIARIVVEFGALFVVTKHVAREPERTAFIAGNAIVLRLILAVLTFAGLIAFAFIAGFAADVRLLIVIGGIGLFWAGINTVLNAVYQARSVLQYSSVGSLAEAISGCILGVSAVLLGADVRVFALTFLTAGLLNVVVLLFFSRKVIRSKPVIDRAEIVAQAKESFPYLLYVIFGVIYIRIGSVILAKLSPESVVGWYGGAFRLYAILNVFPYIFSRAIYPVISKWTAIDGRPQTKTTLKSLEIMIVGAIMVSVAGVSLSKDIIQFFYGLEGYASSVPVLQIFSAGLLFLFVDYVFGTTLLAADMQRQQSILALSAIPVNVALNVVLIIYFQDLTGNGGIGSAIATILTEAYVMIVSIRLMPKGTLSGFRFAVLPKTLLAGAISFAAFWGMELAGVPFILRGVLGMLVFAVSVVVLRIPEKEDIQFVRSLLASAAGRMLFSKAGQQS